MKNKLKSYCFHRNVYPKIGDYVYYRRHDGDGYEPCKVEKLGKHRIYIVGGYRGEFEAWVSPTNCEPQTIEDNHVWDDWCMVPNNWKQCFLDKKLVEELLAHDNVEIYAKKDGRYDDGTYFSVIEIVTPAD